MLKNLKSLAIFATALFVAALNAAGILDLPQAIKQNPFKMVTGTLSLIIYLFMPWKRFSQPYFDSFRKWKSLRHIDYLFANVGPYSPYPKGFEFAVPTGKNIDSVKILFPEGSYKSLDTRFQSRSYGASKNNDLNRYVFWNHLEQVGAIDSVLINIEGEFEAFERISKCRGRAFLETRYIPSIGLRFGSLRMAKGFGYLAIITVGRFIT